MTEGQFSEFAILREGFRDYVASLSAGTPWLGDLQERLRVSRGYDDYRIETPVVYNEALDELGPTGSPRFIVVADTPGKASRNPRTGAIWSDSRASWPRAGSGRNWIWTSALRPSS